MQRISQVGAIMADFGALLTTMSQSVEEEMTNAIRAEQEQAADQMQLTVDDANSKLAKLQSANDSLSTQLLRSNQQLNVAATKLTELETEVLPMAGIDADSVFDNLEELDLVVCKPAASKEARDLIQKLCRDLEPMRARCSPEAPAPKPLPKLAEVADKVAKATGAADANVASTEVPAKA